MEIQPEIKEIKEEIKEIKEIKKRWSTVRQKPARPRYNLQFLHPETFEYVSVGTFSTLDKISDFLNDKKLNISRAKIQNLYLNITPHDFIKIKHI
jgi:hypothetical protein